VPSHRKREVTNDTVEGLEARLVRFHRVNSSLQVRTFDAIQKESNLLMLSQSSVKFFKVVVSCLVTSGMNVKGAVPPFAAVVTVLWGPFSLRGDTAPLVISDALEFGGPTSSSTILGQASCSCPRVRVRPFGHVRDNSSCLRVVGVETITEVTVAAVSPSPESARWWESSLP